MKNEPDAKKPNTLLRRLLAFLLSAALLLGAAAIVIFRDKLTLAHLRRWLDYRTIQAGESGQAEPFTHGGGERLDMACLTGGFLISSAAGPHYYSTSGIELAGQIVPMDQPVLSASSSAGVVYDAGGESLFLFSGEDMVFSYTPDSGGILSARVNNSGWLAVTAQKSRYRGGVTVYNGKQEPVIALNFSSTLVVDAAVSPDCRTVAVVTIGQENGSFQSRLLLYAVDAEEPFATMPLEGFVVLDMDYDSGGIWLLGQSSLVVVSASGLERWDYTFNPAYLKGYALEGDGFAALLLGRYRAGAAREVVTVSQDAQVLARQELEGQVLSLSAAGDYLGLLTAHDLSIYTSGLEPYSVIPNDQGARHVALYSDASALLADSQQAWLCLPS